MSLAKSKAVPTDLIPGMTNVSNSAPIGIAYVIHAMGVGGAERSIARLINGLDRSTFRPIIICMTHSGPAVDWIHDAVPVFELNKRARAYDRRAISRFVSLLRENEIKIVHSHNWGTLIESSVASRRASAKHVHAERGTVLGQVASSGLKVKLRGAVAAIALRKCSAVVSNSNAVAERIDHRCHFPSKRVTVIPNGIEMPAARTDEITIAKLRSELGVPTNANVVGSVGRLSPVKGFDVAIAAMSQLNEHFHFVLVGDGDQMENLKALAHRLGLAARVHFVGHRDDVELWLSMFDLYLNSSHSEGMSQSIVEAMAASLPIVATDVGDSAFLIGNQSTCGKIVPANDASSMALAIREVLDNPGLSKQLGMAASIRQEQFFSEETMVQRYTALYRSLVCR